MSKPFRILITGAGSGVGQGLIKALRLSQLPIILIVGDIAPLNAGLFVADEAVMIPRVEDQDALPRFIRLIESLKLDLVMIGSEFDLEFMSENCAAIEAATGVKIVVAPLQTVKIAADKFLTSEHLRQHGLPYATSHVVGDFDQALSVAEQIGYPLIIKPRTGTSARNVFRIKDRAQLEMVMPRVPVAMLQKEICEAKDGILNEYTCSMVKLSSGETIGPFTARRSLRGGTSWNIEVGHFLELHPIMIAIAKSLDFLGSLNVQLMIGENGPVPFEFNARFSGTTAVRAHFGFNEPEMMVRDLLMGEKIAAPAYRKGLAIRYHEEVFVEDVFVDELISENLPKGIVNQWF